MLLTLSFTVSPALSIAPTAGGTITEVDPYDYVKSVKLVDLDNGNTLAGPMTDANAGATLTVAVPSSYNKVHTEDYELTGGETRHFSVQVDLDQNMASGYQVRAQVRFSDGVSTSSYIKDQEANEFVATSEVIGAGTTALAGNYMTTAANSLTATVASTPTSQSYVKGDSAVPSLGIALGAGDAGDVTVKRLNVRLYGCDNTDDGVGVGNTAGIQCFEDLTTNNDWESTVGNTAADTIVSSVTLYDGNDIVAGPESIDLVDAASNGYTAGADYYVAQFDDLDMTIGAGATKTLTAKVNLLNTATTQMHLALDVDPSADIIAEDDDANTVSPLGAALNAVVAKIPMITIITSGSLTASSEGNPDKDILVAGSEEQLVAKYRFHALDEDFQVRKLTIANDSVADGVADDFGQTGQLDVGPAVSNVVIKYPDVNAVTQSASSSISGGTAKFAGLDFYVPAGEDAYLEVYADVNTEAAVGEALSGQTFRLGLQNTNNDITTFEAIGQSSSNNINFDDANPTAQVTNSPNVESFVVRNSIPSFANVSSSTSLANSEKTLFSFSVTADSAGSVSFGRFVFDVDLTDASGAAPTLTLDDFKFYKGSSYIDDANVYGVAGGDLGLGSGNTITAADTIIVSFQQEESVAAGSSATFSLKANVSGSENDDTVDTNLAIGDENTPVAGLTTNTNENTARVYSATATDSLMAANTEFVQADTTAARNIIWSDKSADSHAYPTVSATAVTAGSGSYDWTNGYLLDITDLSSHSLEK